MLRRPATISKATLARWTPRRTLSRPPAKLSPWATTRAAAELTPEAIPSTRCTFGCCMTPRPLVTIIATFESLTAFKRTTATSFRSALPFPAVGLLLAIRSFKPNMPFSARNLTLTNRAFLTHLPRVIS
jgi:hypothetical protein